jgi:type I restriction enzyme S subunit
VNKELPEGWAEAPVTGFAELIRGVSFQGGEASDSPATGLVAILRANNISDSLKFTDLQYVPEGRISSLQMLRVGDVVIAMSSGSKSVVGKAASVSAPWNGAFGAFCGVLRPSEEIDPNYFGRFFQTRGYRSYVSEVAAGNNINNLKREHFENIQMPLPPLAEQKRIVAKVEALLERVNKARDNLATVPAILKRFRQSVLAAATTGKLTEDWRIQKELSHADWQLLSLGSLGEWRGGGTPSKSDNKFWKDGTIQWISPKDMKSDVILDSLDHITSPGASKLKLLPKDSVLFVVRGMILAHTFPVAITSTSATINQDIRAILPSITVVPKYILFALKNESSGILRAARSSTHGTKRLETDTLKAWLIPVPSIEEQKEIVRRVEVLFALADAIEKRVADATQRVEKITQAILAKAFSGELVATEAELARQEGRTFEPASALLERIKAEHASSTTAKKPRAQTRTKTAPKPAAPAAGEIPKKSSSSSKPANAQSGSIPDRIISAMKPGVEYSRADLLAATGINETDWLWAARQLKDSHQITQTGERRGARYNLTAAKATKSKLVEMPKPAIHNCHAGNDMYNRAALCAYIVKSCHDPRYPLGRVKLAKLFYLTQRLADVHLTQHFEKLAAGPLDIGFPKFLNLAKGHHWLVLDKAIGKLHPVSPGPKIDDSLPQAEKILGDAKSKVDEMLSKMKAWRWETLERWATVLEAALELIELDRPVNIATIKDVLTNNEKWVKKLSREEFSDFHIINTITGLKNHGFFK